MAPGLTPSRAQQAANVWSRAFDAGSARPTCGTAIPAWRRQKRSSPAGSRRSHACHTESAASDGNAQARPQCRTVSKKRSNPSAARTKKKASVGMPSYSRGALWRHAGSSHAGSSASAARQGEVRLSRAARSIFSHPMLPPCCALSAPSA